MTEHLYAHQLTTGATDMLFLNLTIDLGHLVHTQLTGQHHHIGKLCVELQGLNIRDVQLGREVHLHTHLATVGHHGDVASNDGRYLCLDGSIHNLMHGLDILTIDDGVHSEIGLHASLITGGGDIAQVINRKVIGRMGAHVQLLHAKIHGIGSCLQGCSQRVTTAHRGHYFKIIHFHGAKLLLFFVPLSFHCRFLLIFAPKFKETS